MSFQGTVTLTPRVPPKLAEELKRLAARRGTTMNHEMNVALRCHVEADKQRRAKS